MEYNCPAVHHGQGAGFGVDASGDEVTAERKGAGSKRKFRNVGIEPPDVTPSCFGSEDFRHIGFDTLHITVSLGGEDDPAFTHIAHSVG